MKILKKNLNGFQINPSITSLILTIRWIIGGVHTKNLEATLLFVDFSKAFDIIHGKKMVKNTTFIWFPQSVTAIMMLYKNTKLIFFDIDTGVLQGDILAPYISIICLDYILWRWIDLIKQNSFTLIKTKTRRYPAKNYDRRRLRKWFSASCKHTYPSRIPSA